MCKAVWFDVRGMYLKQIYHIICIALLLNIFLVIWFKCIVGWVFTNSFCKWLAIQSQGNVDKADKEIQLMRGDNLICDAVIYAFLFKARGDTKVAAELMLKRVKNEQVT